MTDTPTPPATAIEAERAMLALTIMLTSGWSVDLAYTDDDYFEIVADDCRAARHFQRLTPAAAILKAHAALVASGELPPLPAATGADAGLAGGE